MHSQKGKSIYMPHLPQPGLVPRARCRGRVLNVCFSGEPQNSVDIASLADAIEKFGCRIIHKGKGEWQDLSDVDILLGIRSFSKDRHHSKPPTKLFNAWLAGIPFIGGYDSAYEQVGSPGRNYIRVASPVELLDAINRLTCDSDLYESLVSEGAKAGGGCSPGKTIERWSRFINETVTPAFNDWEETGARTSISRHAKAFFFGLEQRLPFGIPGKLLPPC